MGKRVLAMLIAVVMVMALFTGCISNTKQPNEANTTKEEANEGTASDARVLKVSIGVNDKHPMYIALMEKFKPMVEEKTEGRYKVEVFHSAQLGDDVKSTEALRAGTLEMCVTSTAPLAGMIKEVAIFDIPFLFTSEEVADTILDGQIGSDINDLLPAKGLVNLGWWENGFRHVSNSAREVRTPEDLKGLKIRTMENNYHLEAWRAMGANPTPMSWSEVFIALEQKAMDGQENPIPTIYSYKIHEVNPYITLTGHVYSPLMFLASKQVFDTMSSEDQAIMIEAGREAGLYERQLVREATVKNVEAIEEEGGTVTVLTAEEKKVFQEATTKVWDTISEKVGQELIDKLKDELAKVQ